RWNFMIPSVYITIYIILASFSDHRAVRSPIRKECDSHDDKLANKATRAFPKIVQLTLAIVHSDSIDRGKHKNYQKESRNAEEAFQRVWPGIEPGTSRKQASGCTLSENHTTRPPDLICCWIAACKK